MTSFPIKHVRVGWYYVKIKVHENIDMTSANRLESSNPTTNKSLSRKGYKYNIQLQKIVVISYITRVSS